MLHLLLEADPEKLGRLALVPGLDSSKHMLEEALKLWWQFIHSALKLVEVVERSETLEQRPAREDDPQEDPRGLADKTFEHSPSAFGVYAREITGVRVSADGIVDVGLDVPSRQILELELLLCGKGLVAFWDRPTRDKHLDVAAGDQGVEEVDDLEVVPAVLVEAVNEETEAFRVGRGCLADG